MLISIAKEAKDLEAELERRDGAWIVQYSVEQALQTTSGPHAFPNMLTAVDSYLDMG